MFDLYFISDLKDFPINFWLSVTFCAIHLVSIFWKETVINNVFGLFFLTTRSILSNHFWSFRKQQFSFVIRIFFQAEIFVWTICTRYDMKLKLELGNNPNEMMSVSSLINYVKRLLCNLQTRNQFLLNMSKN